jgi:hypothetical protein
MKRIIFSLILILLCSLPCYAKYKLNPITGNLDFSEDVPAILGVSPGDADLGTFTGTTIADSSTVKDALQSLESFAEAIAPTVEADPVVKAIVGIITSNGTTLTGVTDSAGLRGQISDETGTGVAVFGTSPTFTTQITTPKIVGATDVSVQLGDNAGANAVLITDSDAATVASIDSNGNIDAVTITTAASATPGIQLNDSDSASETIDAEFSANATDTGNGTEDVDVYIKQMIAGTLTTVATFNADGAIEVEKNVALGNGTSSGLLQINEPSGSGTNNATFIVPALAADTDYTLPVDDGGVGEILSTNGSGVLDWVAAAAGGPTYREITFLPESAVLDDTVPPAITIIESTGTSTPRFRVADFDTTADEMLYFTFVLPSDYTASSDPIIEYYWFANDVGPNEGVAWACQVAATTEADTESMIEAAADADILVVTEDCNATEANRLMVTSGTLTYATYMDGAVAGDVVTIRIFRDISDAADDLTSDARLMAVHLKIPRS